MIVGAAAGAIVGGMLSANAAKEAARNKARAYRKAASLMGEANEKYSGEAANQSMTAEGIKEQNTMRNMSGPAQGRGDTQYAQAMDAANQNMNQAASNTVSGYNIGANAKGEENAAQLNYAANKANNILKQADVDAQVANAKNQAIMSGASGLAQLVGQTGAIGAAKNWWNNSGPGAFNSYQQNTLGNATWNNVGSYESGMNSDERLKQPMTDPIDDDKLREAIGEFKALKTRLEELKDANK